MLADAVGDTPETVIPAHMLRRGLCEAWVAGSLPEFDAAIVQSASLREEPWVFGPDVEALWRLLGDATGWKHVNVAQSLAKPLGALIERETGARVRYYGDVYHTLTRTAATFHDPAVRELTLGDLVTLAAAPAEVQGTGFSDVSTMLREGISAGAVVDGRLVAIAHTSAITDRHADIGVSTLEPFRGRGFATAAASIVARRVQASDVSLSGAPGRATPPLCESPTSWGSWRYHGGCKSAPCRGGKIGVTPPSRIDILRCRGLLYTHTPWMGVWVAIQLRALEQQRRRRRDYDRTSRARYAV